MPKVWGIDAPVPVIRPTATVSITTVDLTVKTDKQPEEDTKMGRRSRIDSETMVTIREMVMDLFAKPGYSDADASTKISDKLKIKLSTMAVGIIRRKMNLKRGAAGAEVAAQAKPAKGRRGRKPGTGAKAKPAADQPAALSTKPVTLTEIRLAIGAVTGLVETYEQQTAQRHQRLIEALSA